MTILGKNPIETVEQLVLAMQNVEAKKPLAECDGLDGHGRAFYKDLAEEQIWRQASNLVERCDGLRMDGEKAIAIVDIKTGHPLIDPDTKQPLTILKSPIAKIESLIEAMQIACTQGDQQAAYEQLGQEARGYLETFNPDLYDLLNQDGAIALGLPPSYSEATQSFHPY